jgi:hypothetical protein
VTVGPVEPSLIAEPADDSPRPRRLERTVGPLLDLGVDPQRRREAGSVRIDLEGKLAPTEAEEKRGGLVDGQPDLLHDVIKEVEATRDTPGDSPKDLQGGRLGGRGEYD